MRASELEGHIKRWRQPSNIKCYGKDFTGSFGVLQGQGRLLEKVTTELSCKEAVAII